MDDPDLHHTAAKLAHMLAFHCVRNSSLEGTPCWCFPKLQDRRLHRCESRQPLWGDCLASGEPHE